MALKLHVSRFFLLAAQHTYSMQSVLLKVFWKRIITHMKTYVINTDTEP